MDAELRQETQRSTLHIGNVQTPLKLPVRLCATLPIHCPKLLRLPIARAIHRPAPKNKNRIRVTTIWDYCVDFPSTPTTPANLRPVNIDTPMRFAWSHSPLYTPNIFASNNRDGYLPPCSQLTYPSASTPPSQAEKVKLR